MERAQGRVRSGASANRFYPDDERCRDEAFIETLIGSHGMPDEGFERRKRELLAHWQVATVDRRGEEGKG